MQDILVNMLKLERKRASDVQRSSLTIASRTSAHSVHNVSSELLNGHRHQGVATKANLENGRGDLINRAMSEENMKRQDTFSVSRCTPTTIDDGDSMKAKICKEILCELSKLQKYCIIPVIGQECLDNIFACLGGGNWFIKRHFKKNMHAKSTQHPVRS